MSIFQIIIQVSRLLQFSFLFQMIIHVSSSTFSFLSKSIQNFYYQTFYFHNVYLSGLTIHFCFAYIVTVWIRNHSFKSNIYSVTSSSFVFQFSPSVQNFKFYYVCFFSRINYRPSLFETST